MDILHAQGEQGQQHDFREARYQSDPDASDAQVLQKRRCILPFQHRQPGTAAQPCNSLKTPDRSSVLVIIITCKAVEDGEFVVYDVQKTRQSAVHNIWDDIMKDICSVGSY